MDETTFPSTHLLEQNKIRLLNKIQEHRRVYFFVSLTQAQLFAQGQNLISIFFFHSFANFFDTNFVLICWFFICRRSSLKSPFNLCSRKQITFQIILAFKESSCQCKEQLWNPLHFLAQFHAAQHLKLRFYDARKKSFWIFFAVKIEKIF